MRVFVVGASGAVGTRLVPQLVSRGHEVIGSSRSADRAERLRMRVFHACSLGSLRGRPRS
jgi:uncharacterized protein YbjT (DUF2867 family)